MSELRLPDCPICKREVLLPLSISQTSEYAGGKPYGLWVCSNCGFYITTSDTRAINPVKDIQTGFNKDLCKKVEKMRLEYRK
jgi:hypothetical protein